MNRTITITELQNSGVNSWSVKDDSPRGITTKYTSEIKPGDEVVIDNYFTAVTEAVEPAQEAVEPAQSEASPVDYIRAAIENEPEPEPTKKEEEKTMNENIVTRPEWNKHIKGRAIIWYRRECSAYDLAKRVCGEEVTETEYNAAFNLLNRIQRYALADAAQWERANTFERYANSKQCHEDEKRLDKRREKLVKELGRYNARLNNYGLYPSIVTPEGTDLYALHYFD